jgi:hypothetical protein
MRCGARGAALLLDRHAPLLVGEVARDEAARQRALRTAQRIPPACLIAVEHRGVPTDIPQCPIDAVGDRLTRLSNVLPPALKAAPKPPLAFGKSKPRFVDCTRLSVSVCACVVVGGDGAGRRLWEDLPLESLDWAGLRRGWESQVTARAQ